MKLKIRMLATICTLSVSLFASDNNQAYYTNYTNTALSVNKEDIDKAIEDYDIDALNTLCQNADPHTINPPEPRHSQKSLLLKAILRDVSNDDSRATATLLQAGANPNLPFITFDANGHTCTYSILNSALKHPQYILQLLISYNADPTLKHEQMGNQPKHSTLDKVYDLIDKTYIKNDLHKAVAFIQAPRQAEYPTYEDAIGAMNKFNCLKQFATLASNVDPPVCRA